MSRYYVIRDEKRHIFGTLEAAEKAALENAKVIKTQYLVVIPVSVATPETVEAKIERFPK